MIFACVNTDKNYLKTYVERDLRNIVQVKDLAQFRRFMQLCASRVGSEFVANNLANEIGYIIVLIM